METIYNNHDLVICVEATSNVKPYAEQVNSMIKMVIPLIENVYLAHGRGKVHIRVRFIIFRDFACCPEPVIQTDFVEVTSAPDNLAEIHKFIDGIEYKGGYGYCNALEAVALALQSDWTNLPSKKRHTIMMFSNGKVRPLGGNQTSLAKYPPNMPQNMEELHSMWEGRDPSLSDAFKYAFMLAKVPAVEPWDSMQSWMGYIPSFSSPESICEKFGFEFEFESWMNLVLDY